MHPARTTVLLDALFTAFQLSCQWAMQAPHDQALEHGLPGAESLIPALGIVGSSIETKPARALDWARLSPPRAVASASLRATWNEHGIARHAPRATDERSSARLLEPA